VFESEIPDFPGFCEEKQKFEGESAQKLRPGTSPLLVIHPDVVRVQEHAQSRRPGNFIKFRSTSSRCWWMSRVSDFGPGQSQWLRSSVDVILDSRDQRQFFPGMQITFMGHI
jgi:hypothetical protein